MINLLEIKPNKVSKRIDGYPIVFMGETGDGKTYSMNKFLTEIAPEGKVPLFIMFEDRYKNIDGINAVRVKSLSDLLNIRGQLNIPKVREQFSCVVIDTIDKFEELASRQTAANKDVEIIEDLTFGKGKRYLNAQIGLVSEIRNLGLPVHFCVQSYKNEDIIKKTITYTSKLKDVTKAQIYHDAFLVGMIKLDPKSGNDVHSDRIISFRKTSVYPELKDSFGLPDDIKIQDLATELRRAIEQNSPDGTSDEIVMEELIETVNFDELLKETQDLGGKLFQHENLVNEILSIMSTTLGIQEDGSPRDLNSLHSGQIDLLKMVNYKLNDLVKKHNI